MVLSQGPSELSQAKRLAKQMNISKAEAKEIAKKQGYSDSEINSMTKKSETFESNVEKSQMDLDQTTSLPVIENVNVLDQKNGAAYEQNTNVDEVIQSNGEEVLEIVDETPLQIDSYQETEIAVQRYFGYDIFARDPALFQATSVGVVDPDYLIGPGDEIIVMLWGETQFRQVLKVDREGFVFIPEIGQVFVNGLNLNLLESKLFRVFSQSYASLRPNGSSDAPTTFLDVSLGNLRPLRIQVLGEVAQPGAYTVSPSATLFSALYYFNGPTTLGSLRDIQLIRGGEKIATIDFYDYLLTGKKPKDLKLQLDDVIFIPRRLKTVTILGEVNREGIYELKSEENLSDLINLAGNLKITAYLKRAQIDRVVPFEDRNKVGMDRMYVDVNLEEIFNSNKDFSINDGDRIKIFSVLDTRQNVVSVNGAITRPGSYDLGNSLKLSELIVNAGGLMGDAYKERVDIVRIKSDFTEQLIKLNLGKALKKDLENDIILKGLDRVRIYSMTEMIPRDFVSISGKVKEPGRYVLQENMNLYDLIFKAGGFKDEKFKKATFLDRADLTRTSKNDNKKEIISFDLGLVLEKKGLANLKLRGDDEIFIYSIQDIKGETRYVGISGFVKKPGRYELFEENMRVYDLLFKAGGLDDPMHRSKTFLNRADLIRFEDDRVTQSIIPINLNEIMEDNTSKQNILLQPGDNLRVYSESIFNTVKNVRIRGVVRSPGDYALKKNMNLKDLILEAGGVEENVYRYVVEVARIDPNNESFDEFVEVIQFKVDEKFSIQENTYDGNEQKSSIQSVNNFKLQPYDLIFIRPDPYFNNQMQVTISGEVLYPGQYTITSYGEKISDIIKRAGGLRPNAYLYGSQYFRKGEKINVSFEKIIKNSKQRQNFKVQDGDEIIITSQPNFVRVDGEVNNSGIHKFIPGKRLKYYLKLAGGLNSNADTDNIWVEYPNGDSKKLKPLSLWGPKILDGSIIFISQKEQEEPFDKTEYVKELTSIIANLAQVISVIFLATR